jgi:hypothetical protein
MASSTANGLFQLPEKADGVGRFGKSRTPDLTARGWNRMTKSRICWQKELTVMDFVEAVQHSRTNRWQCLGQNALA